MEIFRFDYLIRKWTPKLYYNSYTNWPHSQIFDEIAHKMVI